MGIATSLDSGIDMYLAEFVTKTTTALCTNLVPVAVAGVTIYIMVYGFAVIRGETNDPLMVFVWKAFKISLIAALALSEGTYQDVVIGTFRALQDGLVQAISGAPSVAQAIDDVNMPFDALSSGLFQKIMDSWGAAAIGWGFAALIVVVAQTLVIIESVGVFLVAKMTFTLTAAVGPLFVLALMFSPTAPLAESWGKQVLQAVLTNVLVTATLSMATSFATQYAERVLTNSAQVNVVSASISLLIASVVLVQIVKSHPLLAQALAGGLALGGMGGGLPLRSMAGKNQISPGGAQSALANGLSGGASIGKQIASAAGAAMAAVSPTAGAVGRTASQVGGALYNRHIRSRLGK